MLEHEKVPRFMISAPGLNPHLTGLLEGSRLDVPTETDQLLGDDALVGVSSFGFSGNNVHIVVSSAPVGRKVSGWGAYCWATAVFHRLPLPAAAYLPLLAAARKPRELKLLNHHP